MLCFQFQLAALHLGEEPGQTCGYAVGNGERVAGPRTKLLFVTSGWLLTMLSHNPAEVHRYTHVILVRPDQICRNFL